MTPAEIKVGLERRKTSLANICRELNVASSSVTNVVKGRMVSARIESAIASALDKPLYQVFPDRHPTPVNFSQPEMVSIPRQELDEMRSVFEKATKAIDRLCA